MINVSMIMMMEMRELDTIFKGWINLHKQKNQAGHYLEKY